MILRRVSQHVKDLNWFAVGVDLVIVFIGVFFGLQVANWNDALAKTAQAERLLSRMEADLFGMRVLVADQQAFHYENTVALDALLTQVEAGDIAVNEGLYMTLNNAMSSITLPDRPVSFEEMLATGKLDLLSSAPMRDSIRDLAITIEANGRAATTLEGSFTPFVNYISRYVTFGRAPYPTYHDDMFTIEAVDTAGLLEDEDARHALLLMFNYHTVMQTLAEDTVNKIDGCLAEIQTDAFR